MNELIAVLRRCARCREHRSIDEFRGLAHLCDRCILTNGLRAHATTIVRSRAIVLTNKGRNALMETAPVA